MIFINLNDDTKEIDQGKWVDVRSITAVVPGATDWVTLFRTTPEAEVEGRMPRMKIPTNETIAHASI